MVDGWDMINFTSSGEDLVRTVFVWETLRTIERKGEVFNTYQSPHDQSLFHGSFNRLADLNAYAVTYCQ